MTAVGGRLADNWSTTAIVDPDVTDSGPADGSAYVTIEYPSSKENQITIGSPGNNVWRESGAFRIVLNSPSGQSAIAMLVLMDQLRAIFRGKQFSGVTIFAPSPGFITQANYQAGRFIVSCAVPYQYDFFA
jgi:hypothetical protein